MIEDMRLRKLDGKTQIAYIRAVRRLAGFLRRSPDTATGEDLRRFQLHMVDQGTSSMTINATISGLRFFFEITLERGELMAMMSPVREPRKLPVILSREEVARLIAAARNPKHRAALSVAYGAGLRASEVISLKVGDIDSERMTLRVEQGKGRKDRYAMLSPVLLGRLRAWWRVCTAFATRSPPTCSSRRSTSASSRCCSGTRSWRRRRSIHRSALRSCAKWFLRSRSCPRRNPPSWGAPPWRSPTSSALTGRLGERRSALT
jgi:integrase